MWAQLGIWIVIGVALANLHLWLLHRAIESSGGMEPEAAGRRLVHGMWLRVSLWLPALSVAAMSGIWACVGLVLGSLGGRWLAYRWVGSV